MKSRGATHSWFRLCTANPVRARWGSLQWRWRLLVSYFKKVHRGSQHILQWSHYKIRNSSSNNHRLPNQCKHSSLDRRHKLRLERTPEFRTGNGPCSHKNHSRKWWCNSDYCSNLLHQSGLDPKNRNNLVSNGIDRQDQMVDRNNRTKYRSTRKRIRYSQHCTTSHQPRNCKH